MSGFASLSIPGVERREGRYDVLRVPDLSAAFPINGTGFVKVGSSRSLGALADNHFTAQDVEIIASLPAGSSRLTIGSRKRLQITGAPADPQLFGDWVSIFTNNLTPSGSSARIYGYYAGVDVGGPFSEVYGGYFFAGSGGFGSNGSGLICGSRSTVGIAHNTDGNTFYGADAIVQSTSSSPFSTSALAAIVRASLSLQNGNAITDLRGLHIGDFVKVGTGAVGTSRAIYIDASVDVGATAYAIDSESVSLSRFLGDLEIATNAKGVVLRSPNNTRWRLQVSNAGALSAVAI